MPENAHLRNDYDGYGSASDYDEETLPLIMSEEHGGDGSEHETQYMATEDGGYDSASDYDEESLALITREEHGGGDSDH